MRTRNSNILGGILFVIAAILLLIGQLDFFREFNLFKIFAGIILIGIFLRELFHRSFFVSFCSLAVFCTIFRHTLHLDFIAVPYFFAAAILLAIGLGILFPNKYQNHYGGYYQQNGSSSQTGSNGENQDHSHFDQVIDEEDGSIVRCSANFSSAVKYVNTQSLTQADILCSFAGVKIYFDHAAVPSGNATIHVDVSFGGVELYIPRNWLIRQNTQNFMGGVEIKGGCYSDAHTVIDLTGSIRCAGVTIHYI